ncbi:MAG: hypothetical protein AAF432_06050 [Planctomycetota bacterium]
MNRQVLGLIGMTAMMTSMAISADAPRTLTRGVADHAPSDHAVSIDDVLATLIARHSGADGGGGGGFLGYELTQEDFSDGWYDEDRRIISDTSLDGGPPTNVKTAFAWNGGVDTLGNTVRGFKEDFNVYRLWAIVSEPTTSVAAYSSSQDNGIPMVFDTSGSGFYQWTTGLGTQVNPNLMRLWRGNVGDPLYRQAFDTYLTIGSATTASNSVVDPDNQLVTFESTCDASVVASNVGIIVTPQAGFGVVARPGGGWRVMLAQLTVRKGFALSGSGLLSGPGLGSNFGTWSSSDEGMPSDDVFIEPLGTAGLNIGPTGDITINNIGSTGEDGLAVNLSQASESAFAEGYGVTLMPIDLRAAGDGAAISTECEIDDCFTTLFKPSMELENTDGAIFGSAFFPQCVAVDIQFWNDGLFQLERTVQAGLLFEILDVNPLMPTMQDVICLGDGIRVTFANAGSFRVLFDDSMVTADEVRMRPSICESPFGEAEDASSNVSLLAIRARNLDALTTTQGSLDPICAGDVSPPDGNGVRNIDDAIAVILAWGSCTFCPEDAFPINAADSMVGVDDLLVVLNNFGPCAAP